MNSMNWYLCIKNQVYDHLHDFSVSSICLFTDFFVIKWYEHRFGENFVIFFHKKIYQLFFYIKSKFNGRHFKSILCDLSLKIIKVVSLLFLQFFLEVYYTKLYTSNATVKQKNKIHSFFSSCNFFYCFHSVEPTLVIVRYRVVCALMKICCEKQLKNSNNPILLISLFFVVNSSHSMIMLSSSCQIRFKIRCFQ